jgi:hypothetical protein
MGSTIYRAYVTVQFTADPALTETVAEAHINTFVADAMAHYKQDLAKREGQRLGVTFDWYVVESVEDEAAIWGDDE